MQCWYGIKHTKLPLPTWKEKRKEEVKKLQIEMKWRGRGQTTRGVTPGRLRGKTGEGVTLMLLTPPLHRKV